jgi:DNA-binding MurR/RpiR family transcriptional regulator
MQIAEVNTRIHSRYDSLSPELQRAARWVTENPAEIGLYSMRAVARRASLQPASLSRLAQALGFARYEDLRHPFRAGLALAEAGDYAGRAAMLQEPGRMRHGAAEAGNALQQGNVASILSTNPAHAFADAARDLLEARRIAVLGLRASHGVAHHFQYLLNMLCDNSLLLTDTAGTLIDQVCQLGKDDLLVAFSQAPYTRQTGEVVRKAATRGIPVIAMTDSPLSPIGRAARRVLLARTDTASYFQSMTGALALGETLLQAVASLGGEAVLRRLRAIQGHLESERAYVDGVAHPGHISNLQPGALQPGSRQPGTRPINTRQSGTKPGRARPNRSQS